ncbi:unnamed protein product [Spirodela intermedia]|uniref:Uncharacterized protein n=1 Tax=Spirodela intermedia TaxID=51605 RepID=A0ABN7EBX3_SPIIN|nr:unnamed protein product [Spirodela intermedia]
MSRPLPPPPPPPVRQHQRHYHSTLGTTLFLSTGVGGGGGRRLGLDLTNSGVARSVGNGPALAWHHGNPWTVVNPSLHGRCRMPESYGSHSNEAPSTASNLQYQLRSCGCLPPNIVITLSPPPSPMISGIFRPISRGAVHHIPDVREYLKFLHFLLTKENTWTVPTCYRRPPLRAMPLPSNPYDQIADPPSFSLGDHQTA